MKIACACFASAFFVAVLMGGYAAFESGFSVMMFGVAVIAFVYALSLVLVIGLPLFLVLKKCGKLGRSYFAACGALIGGAFAIVPLVGAGGADVSVMKLAIVLVVAGFFGGLIFRQIAID